MHSNEHARAPNASCVLACGMEKHRNSSYQMFRAPLAFFLVFWKRKGSGHSMIRYEEGNGFRWRAVTRVDQDCASNNQSTIRRGRRSLLPGILVVRAGGLLNAPVSDMQ